MPKKKMRKSFVDGLLREKLEGLILATIKRHLQVYVEVYNSDERSSDIRVTLQLEHYPDGIERIDSDMDTVRY